MKQQIITPASFKVKSFITELDKCWLGYRGASKTDIDNSQYRKTKCLSQAQA